MSIFQSIRESAKRFPRCRIANCECDSYGEEWVPECDCLCHLLQLQEQTDLDLDLVEFTEYKNLNDDGRIQWLHERYE